MFASILSIIFFVGKALFSISVLKLFIMFNCASSSKTKANLLLKSMVFISWGVFLSLIAFWAISSTSFNADLGRLSISNCSTLLHKSS